MSPTETAVIIEPHELNALLKQRTGLVVVDLSQEASYELQHIPGAVHIDAARLGSSRPPVMGLLPPEDSMRELLSNAGITPDSYVVAYDNENGLKACRFLWLLDVIGHPHFSLLNGGLSAWRNAGLPLDDRAVTPAPADYPVSYSNAHSADKRYIFEHLHDPKVVILDARTPAEYNGTDRRALRAGHIPGAVNLDWSRAIVGGGDFRVKPAEQLRAMYSAAGVTPDKEVIVHCQTHQRSSHTYIVLKSLGYTRIKGYPGSWSDWGNDPEMPVE
jgi:thiosulfate/3-mercaptopyruvate sulfurtransferase